MDYYGKTRPAVSNSIKFENTLSSFSLNQLKVNGGTNRYSHNILNEQKKESIPPVLRRGNVSTGEQYRFTAASKSIDTQRIEASEVKQKNDEVDDNRVRKSKPPVPKQVDERTFNKSQIKEVIIDDNNDDEDDDDIEEEQLEPSKNTRVIPEARNNDVSNSVDVSNFQLEFEKSLNESVSTLNHVLMTIAPNCTLRCTIKRNSKRLPTYTMYVEKHDGNYQKLLIAQTIRRLPSIYMRVYAVKLANDNSRRNLVLLGKLKANVQNNNFILTGFLNASDTMFDDSDDETAGAQLREEHLSINYKDISLFSTNKIQRFRFFIPQERKLTGVRNSISRFSQRSSVDENNNFLTRYSIDQPLQLIAATEFISREPKYNDKKGTYTLNFNGRVSETSAHNCQATPKQNQAITTFQVGKIGKNTYICDFTCPLTPFQAFGIALSNLCR